MLRQFFIVKTGNANFALLRLRSVKFPARREILLYS